MWDVGKKCKNKKVLLQINDCRLLFFINAFATKD
jgi:hypothetical protein